MKKVLLSVTVFLLCFSFGFWLKKSVPKSPAPVTKAETVPVAEIAKASVQNAHRFYFSDQLAQSASSPIFWEKTEERFQFPLPEDSSKHQANRVRELATRLSILRSISSLDRFHNEKILLFSKIVKDPNQHWLLRREALFQLRPFLRTLGEKEREKILAAVPSRVRALASASTQELLLAVGSAQ